MGSRDISTPTTAKRHKREERVYCNTHPATHPLTHLACASSSIPRPPRPLASPAASLLLASRFRVPPSKRSDRLPFLLMQINQDRRQRRRLYERRSSPRSKTTAKDIL